MKHRILVLNGPNLNLLGQREPDIYGILTLEQINQLMLEHLGQREFGLGEFELDFCQSNHEGVLIDTLHAAQGEYCGVIFNPAAYTHYSIAIRDALAAITVPVVEVHLSDIRSREAFRHDSLISDVAAATFMGKGAGSYLEALDFLTNLVTSDLVGHLE
ncbi:MAG: 3-dehydroquinate dehydratase [Coriobacteriales bacterium]|jgi:3-dehydroquinate dehydratase-2|nr:3-dehydroquinate dehydratase [Coriobacteriales bacterium]